MVNTYIGDDARFPPHIWSAAPDSDGQYLPRTTNACESFHKHLKQAFGSAHPNIYTFSNVIRLLQEETYVKIQSVSASRHISSKDKAKHAFVADMYKKYQDGSISRAVYIATICHKYLPVDLHNQRDNGHCSSDN